MPRLSSEFSGESSEITKLFQVLEINKKVIEVWQKRYLATLNNWKSISKNVTSSTAEDPSTGPGTGAGAGIPSSSHEAPSQVSRTVRPRR